MCIYIYRWNKKLRENVHANEKRRSQQCPAKPGLIGPADVYDCDLVPVSCWLGHAKSGNQEGWHAKFYGVGSAKTAKPKKGDTRTVAVGRAKKDDPLTKQLRALEDILRWAWEKDENPKDDAFFRDAEKALRARAKGSATARKWSRKSPLV